MTHTSIIQFIPDLLYISISVDQTTKTKLRGFGPQSELYRPSDRRLSGKLVPTLADRGLSRGQRNKCR
jgi:hypothetical protein